MKSLVKLLKITLVEEDETLNKEINNRLFDHIMGAIESVSGKFGHYYIEVCLAHWCLFLSTASLITA
jgi:hypothetical protein